jgi:chromosome transmission fidelity protein 4
VVDVTDQETHNVINVEFHDKSARRGYHFQDHSKFTMASLGESRWQAAGCYLVLILTFTGEQGVVFAAPSEDESPSTVYYRPYDSWASQSDWTVSLLPGEDAVVVAAGGSAGDGMGSIAVATSKGFLRFFTTSGIQRYIWSLGEEVITLAAGKEAVIIVHREGGTSLDGESIGRAGHQCE